MLIAVYAVVVCLCVCVCVYRDYIKFCQKDDKSPLKGAWLFVSPSTADAIVAIH